MTLGKAKDEIIHDIQMPTPRQANGCDCGVYVLALADVLCRAAVAGKLPQPGETHPDILALTPADVSEQRHALLQTVLGRFALAFPAPSAS